jgi:DNA-binding CsgD family transcriptional regulator
MWELWEIINPSVAAHSKRCRARTIGVFAAVFFSLVHTGLGMWVWDVARDEVWMTEKGRALLGFARDTRLDAAALISRVHPEDRAARAGAIKRAIEARGEYCTEYRALLPDGTLRWIGAELGVTLRTIKTHRARVIQKLGAVSVAELVRLAQKAGVAPADGV